MPNFKLLIKDDKENHNQKWKYGYTVYFNVLHEKKNFRRI